MAIIMAVPLCACDPRRDLSEREIERYLDMAIEQIYAMDFEKGQDEQVAAMFEILKKRDGLEKSGLAAYNDFNFIDLHLQKEQCEKIEYFSEYDDVFLRIYFRKKGGFVFVGIDFFKYYDGTCIQEILHPKK